MASADQDGLQKSRLVANPGYSPGTSRPFAAARLEAMRAYQAVAIRRVRIRKSQGCARRAAIPNILHRAIQQALYLDLVMEVDSDIRTADWSIQLWRSSRPSRCQAGGHFGSGGWPSGGAPNSARGAFRGSKSDQTSRRCQVAESNRWRGSGYRPQLHHLVPQVRSR